MKDNYLGKLIARDQERLLRTLGKVHGIKDHHHVRSLAGEYSIWTDLSPLLAANTDRKTHAVLTGLRQIAAKICYRSARRLN